MLYILIQVYVWANNEILKMENNWINDWIQMIQVLENCICSVCGFIGNGNGNTKHSINLEQIRAVLTYHV